MNQDLPKKRFGLAIALNAFVMPGAGHILLGEKFKGYSIGTIVTLLLILPLVRYCMAVFEALQRLSVQNGITAASVQALSSAWTINRKFILISLTLVLIVWIYGVADIVMLKTKNSARH